MILLKCVFRFIWHLIPVLSGTCFRSEATHSFKITKGAGTMLFFSHRITSQLDFIGIVKNSIAYSICYAFFSKNRIPLFKR